MVLDLACRLPSSCVAHLAANASHARLTIGHASEPTGKLEVI